MNTKEWFSFPPYSYQWASAGDLTFHSLGPQWELLRISSTFSLSEGSRICHPKICFLGIFIIFEKLQIQKMLWKLSISYSFVRKIYIRKAACTCTRNGGITGDIGDNVFTWETNLLHGRGAIVYQTLPLVTLPWIIFPTPKPQTSSSGGY